MSALSPFLQLPCELRLEIYAHLFQPSPELPKPIHLRAPRFPQLAYSARSILSRKQPATVGAAAGKTALTPFGHVERASTGVAHEAAILLCCRKVRAEALDIYWGGFTIVLDSPIKFVPLLLDRIPLAVRPCLKSLSLSRHLVRPLDPTAAGHARTWREVCLLLSCTLPRIEEVGLDLHGDIGTLAMEEGRENVLHALVACGWVGKRGKLRRLTLTWGCSGWEEEGAAAVALVALGARATMEKKDGVVRRIFGFEDRKAPLWRWDLDSRIAPCCDVACCA
ncbi:hypothetical protein AOQ84DRAFT_204650 [Glonium stellatum]|uniref:Uncharacterized protein n=1 Tax=Glonium stellatum TaxID=574774 RepID=A0A8E2JVG0_9PEZI|nr:hypothetical protein AOQ84DRAFT_204650 [Glonium stellatum]